MKPQILFFAHVPKTAGLTFSSILARNYRSQYIRILSRFLEPDIPPQNIRLFLDKGTGTRAVASHRISCKIPYDHPAYDVRCVSFLRNPVERLASEYYYVKRLKRNEMINASETLEDFVGKLEQSDPETTWFINAQSKKVDLETTERRKQMSARKLFLLPVEEYDKCLLVLQQQLKGLRDVSYVKQNVNRHKDRRMNPSLRERIERLNEKDAALYAEAVGQLRALSEEALPGEAMGKALKRLRRACHLRRLFLNPVESFLDRLARGSRYITLPN